MLKQLRIVFCVSILIAAMAATSSFAANAPKLLGSGVCGAEGDGDNIKWEFYDDGSLYIHGHGEMRDYGLVSNFYGYYSYAPWIDVIDSQNRSVKLHIAPGVESIGAYAFFDQVKSAKLYGDIKLPSTIKRIGRYAFYGCGDITSVNLPDGLEIIGEHAFFECKKLSGSLIIPDSVKEIYGSAFEGCSSYTDLHIGKGLTSLGDSAFGRCSGMSGTLEIPNNIVAIGGYCFSSCGFDKVNLGRVQTIGGAAFAYCPNLELMIIPSSVKTIGSHAFRGGGIKDLYFEGNKPGVDFGYVTANNADAVKIWGPFDTDTNLYYINGDITWSDAAWYYIYYPKVWVKGVEKYLNYSSSDQLPMFVIDSKGNPISQAEIILDDLDPIYTDKDGFALLSGIDRTKSYKLTINKEGYRIHEEDVYVFGEKSFDVFKLYSKSESELLLKAAFYSKGDLTANILTGKKTISTLAGEFTLVTKAIGEAKKYELVHCGVVIAESTDGIFRNLYPNRFTPGKDILVRAYGSGGVSVDTKINLSIIDEMKKDWKVSFGGSSGKITVPDDVPFIGGTSVDLSLAELSDLDVFVSEDEGKLKIHVGVNHKFAGDIPEDKEQDYINMCEGYRKLFDDDIDGELLENLSKIFKGDETQKIDLPGAKNVEAHFIGYGEGIIDDGISEVNMHIGLIISYKDKDQHTKFIGFVPVTYGYEFKASLKADAIGEYDFNEKHFTTTFGLTPKVKFKPNVGVGLDEYVGLVVTGSAELAVEIVVGGEYFLNPFKEVTLEGESGIKLYVKGVFEIEETTFHNKWYLYTQNVDNDENVLLLSDEISDSGFGIGNIYDEESYSLVCMDEDIAYPEWMADTEEVSTEGAANSISVLQSAGFNYMDPVIADANGVPVMVWVDIDPERDEYNKAQLVYSVYYSENGQWSAPSPVDSKNTTIDSTPFLYTDGDGNLWLAYQNTSEVIDADTSLNEFGSMQDVTIAKFDGSKFTAFEHIEAETNLYRNPVIGTIGDKLVLAWASNGDNRDYFCQNNTNEICYAFVDGNGVGDVQTISGLNTIIDMCIAPSGIAFICDDDCSFSSIGDRTLCIADIDTAEDLTPADDEEDLAPADDAPEDLAPADDAEDLTCIDSGNIAALNVAALASGEESLLYVKAGTLYEYEAEESTAVLINEDLMHGYEVLSDCIIYNLNFENESNLMGMFYADGKWSEPIQLTRQDAVLQTYSACEIADKKYCAAVQTYPIIGNGGIIESHDLSWMILKGFNDLSIQSFVADNFDEATEGIVSISASVKNIGANTVDGFSITVGDANTTLYNEKYDVNLLPGEVYDLDLEIDVSDVNSLRDYKFSLICDNDIDESNNESLFKAGYADLQMKADTLIFGTREKLMLSIGNVGKSETGGRVNVMYRDDVLMTEYVDAIAPGKSSLVVIDVDDNLLGEDISRVLRFEIVSDDDEYNQTNNSDMLLVHSGDCYIDIKSIDDGIANVHACSDTDAIVVLTVLDSDGKLKAVHTREISSGFDGDMEIELTKASSDSIKMMMVDSSFVPLCAADSI